MVAVLAEIVERVVSHREALTQCQILQCIGVALRSAHRAHGSALAIPAAAAALAEGVDELAVEGCGRGESRRRCRVVGRIIDHCDLVDAAVDDPGFQPHDIRHLRATLYGGGFNVVGGIGRIVFLPDGGAGFGFVVIHPVHARIHRTVLRGDGRR